MASKSDAELALEILRQIDAALTKIRDRASRIDSAEAFSSSPEGEERLDALCMLFIAVGEALKNLHKVTNGSLLWNYPEIDWKGAMGFRDVIAHQYFDIDPEQVWWICTHEVAPLSAAIKRMIAGLTMSAPTSSDPED